MTVYADRVKETTTTTGTGTYSLGGAQTGFQTFVAGAGTGVLVTYTVEDGTNWEICEGTLTSGTPSTITRTTLIASSTGSFISWGTGTRNIFLTASSARIATIDKATAFSSTLSSTGNFTSSATITGNTFLTSASNAVAAAGTTQGTATALTTDFSVVTSGTGGVSLATATAGRIMTVVNKTSSAINVYPASGHSIDGYGSNTGFSLPVNGMVEVYCVSSSQWYTTQNAIINGSMVTGAVASATTATNVAASGLTGTTLASGVTGSSLTSVGTLGSLTVSGNATLNQTLTFTAGANSGLSVTNTTTSPNGSIVFSSGGQRIRLPSSSLLQFGTNAFTIEFWIKAGSSQQPYATICDSTTNNTGVEVGIGTNDSGVAGKIGFQLATGYYLNSATTVTDNTWRHIACVRNGANGYIFINGVLDASTTAWTGISNTNGLYGGTLGGSNYGSATGTDNYIVGNLTCFRVSNNARYTSGFTAPTSIFTNDANTILLLNEVASGNLYTDSSSNAFSLTYANAAPSWILASPFASGGGSAAFAFDGSNWSTLQGVNPASISCSGPIASTQTAGAVFSAVSATTSSIYNNWRNTAGSSYAGIESSAGASIFPGTAAYSTVFGSVGNYSLHFVNSNAVRVTIDASGNLVLAQTATGTVNANGVALGVAGTEYINHVSGTASGANFAVYGYNGASIGSITQNGTTAVAYNTTSDYRLKSNVTPIPGDEALGRLALAGPSHFVWTSDGSNDMGFIADVFQNPYPRSVTGQKDAVDADGNSVYQQMDNSGAVPDLVAAVTYLSQQVTALQARLTAAGIA